MIRVNKDYAIDFDSKNVTLYKISKKGKESKNPGQEIFSALGYYGKFEHLIGRLLQDKLAETIRLLQKYGEIEKDLSLIETLQEILDKIEEFKQDILKSIIEIKPDTKPYKYKLETDD